MKQKIFAVTVLKFALPMLLFGNMASAATTQGTVAPSVNSMTRAPAPYTQCVSFSYNMARGSTDRSTNYEVSKLQKLLKTKDNLYPEGWVTGYFGTATERAVKRLQKKLAIDATGRFDEVTRRTLKEYTCEDEARDDATLSVTVINSSIACVMAPCPNAVSGVVVRLNKDGKYITSGVTDNNGKVLFGELEPGTYIVEASQGDLKAVEKINVTEGVIQSLVLNLGFTDKPTSNLPIIDGVTGPTKLEIGVAGTWSVSARHPQNGTLSYSVNWGDEYSYAVGAINRMINDTEVRQTSTFMHAYQKPGTYMIIFYVKNETGEYAKSTMTVTVGRSVSNDTPRVISPNGGEYWNRGYNQAISWTGPTQPPCPAGAYCAPMAPRYYDITLESYPNIPPCLPYAPCPMYSFLPVVYKIASGVYGSQYSWVVGQNLDSSRYIPDGQYKITVCDTVSGVCDSSDSPFTINSYTVMPVR